LNDGDHSGERSGRMVHRDTFADGVPSESSDSDDDIGSSDKSSSEGGDDIDDDETDFASLANEERLLDRTQHPRSKPAPPPPQRAPMPFVAPPPPRTPDFMGSTNHQDDGFVGPDLMSLDQQKLELLHNIQRMAANGNAPQVSLSMESSYEQISQEYARMKKSGEIQRSVKFQRRCLLAASSGVEFLSKRMTFMKLNLSGFAEATLDSIADFDSAFEECHEEYGDSIKMSPVYTVFFMWVSSIIAFHLSTSLYSSVLPSVSQTLSNNPEVMQQVAAAMQGMVGTPKGDPVIAPEVPSVAAPKQSAVVQSAPPLNFPNAPPPAAFAGPPPPMASRIETIAEEQLPSMPPDDEVVSVVSDGGTRSKVRRARKPPGPDTLVL